MPGGRPRGLAKTGGRKAGTPNRSTAARAAALVQAAQAADMQLSNAVLACIDSVDAMRYILRCALRAGQVALALDAAKSLAPYEYAKLSNIEVSTMQKRTMVDYSDEELAEVISGRLDLSDEALADAEAIRKRDDERAEVSRKQAERNALQLKLATPRSAVVEDGEGEK